MSEKGVPLTDLERAALVARIDGSQTFERLANYKALLRSARAKLLGEDPARG